MEARITELVLSVGNELEEDFVYVNQRTKFKIKCHHCNKYYEKTLKNLPKSPGCSNCSKHLARKEFCETVEDDYLNTEFSGIFVDIKCKTCLESYKIRWTNFARGSRCTKCFIKKTADGKRTSQDSVKKQFSDKGFDLLDGHYENNKTVMKVKCQKCGKLDELSLYKMKRRLTFYCC